MSTRTHTNGLTKCPFTGTRDGLIALVLRAEKPGPMQRRHQIVVQTVIVLNTLIFDSATVSCFGLNRHAKH